MTSQTESDSPRPVIGLALEVIGREGSVALICDGEVAQTDDLPGDVRATASLTPALQSLLLKFNPVDSNAQINPIESAAATRASRPDFIAVADGPGSFTGLRIAAATAKTLAYAWGIPVVTSDSLSVLAAAILPPGISRSGDPGVDLPDPGQRLIVGLDAYRGQTFVGSFEATDSGWQSVREVELMDRAEWLAALESASPGTWVTGDAIKLGLPTEHLRPVRRKQTLASALAGLSHQKFLAGQTTDPMEVLPKYFRPSAAEEKAASSRTGSAKG
ncbi:tRNA (adenosine(37)-N6)-threonylcarbamoyltransferase complex dimerization subunit type 1 TsaB [Rhodopirellula bahusiensis]|uniref:tRNA (adenosine(37)-N6)-threonylcarbamoyltransferase complex dimerization subunit type 1 TsaB n=1 Tax=Rhodopirellula bahusiensis TaxID=2014065 RepID=UPI003265E449